MRENCIIQGYGSGPCLCLSMLTGSMPLKWLHMRHSKLHTDNSTASLTNAMLNHPPCLLSEMTFIIICFYLSHYLLENLVMCPSYGLCKTLFSYRRPSNLFSYHCCIVCISCFNVTSVRNRSLFVLSNNCTYSYSSYAYTYLVKIKKYHALFYSTFRSIK